MAISRSMEGGFTNTRWSRSTSSRTRVSMTSPSPPASTAMANFAWSMACRTDLPAVALDAPDIHGGLRGGQSFWMGRVGSSG